MVENYYSSSLPTAETFFSVLSQGSGGCWMPDKYNKADPEP